MDGTVRRLSVEEIFGVSLPTLKAMADISSGTVRLKGKNWKKQRISYTIPDNSLVVFTANRVKKAKIIFDKKFPLRGKGVVVIDGDCEVKKDSNSQFQGILVVLGELKVHGPAKFTGTVVIQKKSHLHGRKQNVRFDHDPALVTQMINELSKYRRFKTSFVPAPARLDERPNEEFLSERRLGGLQFDAQATLTSSEIVH
jgi:hypothetical protein